MLEAADMLNYFSGGLDAPCCLCTEVPMVSPHQQVQRLLQSGSRDVTLKYGKGYTTKFGNDPEKEEVIQYAID
ncbi:MAG: hypothetical protein R2795_05140 [Saprospiraceae bacterium]